MTRIPLAICGSCALLNATGLATGWYRFHGPEALKAVMVTMLFICGVTLLARAARRSAPSRSPTRTRA
jgi:hypothetical protein